MKITVLISLLGLFVLGACKDAAPASKSIHPGMGAGVSHCGDSVIRARMTSDSENEGVWEWFVAGASKPVQSGTWSRDLEVLWAPDCRCAAITVHWGSNSTDVDLVDSEKGPLKGEGITMLVDKPKGAEISHQYNRAVRWLDNNHLLVSVSGDYTIGEGPSKDIREEWILSRTERARRK